MATQNTTPNMPTTDEFRTRLKRHGLKATRQRLEVHEAMRTLGHASADMVSEEIGRRGNVKVTVNGTAVNVACEKVAKNDWHKLKVPAQLKEGSNNLIITNTGGTGLVIDQIIYMPAGTPAEKFLVTVREDNRGTVTPNVSCSIYFKFYFI